MLWALWITSVFLSAISLMIMAVLILRRLLMQRRLTIRNNQGARLQKALIEFSETRNSDALFEVMESIPPAIVLEAGFEFLALLRGDEHARIIAVFTQAGLVGQAIRLLKHGNKIERVQAVEMLGAFANPEGTQALLSAFESERSDEGQIAIAIALSQLGKLPPLDQVLDRISEAGKRSRRIAELFSDLPQDRLPELKAFAIRPEETPLARAAAIEAIGSSGDPALLDFMQSLSNDASPDVAAAAIRTLGRIGDPTASPALIRAMADARHNDLRTEAAEAAGRIGSLDLAEPLVQLLSDDIWTVRYAAGKSLRAIPGGLALLKRVAEGTASRGQRMASLVLSEGEVA